MAKTESVMAPLGWEAPYFELLDCVSQTAVSSLQVQGKSGLLVMFICNHCPFVLHIEDALIKLGYDYKDSDIGIVAICSNDVANYPEDHPDKMRERAISKQYPFPYLYDADQQVAKNYNAQCTPDFFLFDAYLKCYYRGRMDEARPGNDIPTTGDELRQAMDALIAGAAAPQSQKPSVGCNIKWLVA